MWYDIESFNTNESVMKMRKIKSTTNKLDAEILNLVIEEKAAKAAVNSREDITGYEKVCQIEQLVLDYGRKKRVLLAEKKKTEEEAALLAELGPGGDGGGCDADDDDGEEEVVGESPATNEVDAATPADEDHKKQEGDSETDILMRKITRVAAMAKIQGLC
jgi:hypothetical protein